MTSIDSTAEPIEPFFPPTTYKQLMKGLELSDDNDSKWPTDFFTEAARRLRLFIRDELPGPVYYVD